LAIHHQNKAENFCARLPSDTQASFFFAVKEELAVVNTVRCGRGCLFGSALFVGLGWAAPPVWAPVFLFLCNTQERKRNVDDDERLWLVDAKSPFVHLPP
jgi:hypothetical protein